MATSRKASPQPVTNVVKQVAGTHYEDSAGVCPHCGGKIEHWDLFARVPYLEAQIAKYVLRWPKKGGLVDLRKGFSVYQKLLNWAEQHYKEGS